MEEFDWIPLELLSVLDAMYFNRNTRKGRKVSSMVWQYAVQVISLFQPLRKRGWDTKQ